jgi:tRNA threonylcarbamoyl adenosine modification protein YeaZ
VQNPSKLRAGNADPSRCKLETLNSRILTLAIETSATPATVAAAFDGCAPESLAFAGPRPDIGRMLIPGMRDLLLRMGAAPSDIGRVVAGAGPGTYTGLRVGLAAAKTLAFVSRAPIVAFPSFLASALAAFRESPGARTALVAIDALRGDMAAASYRLDGGLPVELTRPSIVPRAALRERFEGMDVVATDRPDAVRAAMGQDRAIVASKPSAALLIELDRLSATPLPAPAPIYLRASAAEERASKPSTP